MTFGYGLLQVVLHHRLDATFVSCGFSCMMGIGLAINNMVVLAFGEESKEEENWERRKKKKQSFLERKQSKAFYSEWSIWRKKIL